jgi:hypothetical protein
MTQQHHWLDTLSRREVFGHVARATLGVGLLPSLSRQLEAAVDGKKPQAKNIIYLMMQGAMSHLDTFDPKPGRDEQGETKTIPTKTPGIVFGQSLEKLASLSDRLAVVRSLSSACAISARSRIACEVSVMTADMLPLRRAASMSSSTGLSGVGAMCWAASWSSRSARP